jgi:hypothetical protein
VDSSRWRADNKKFDQRETDIGRASASREVNALACKSQPGYLGNWLPQCSLAIYGGQAHGRTTNYWHMNKAAASAAH